MKRTSILTILILLFLGIYLGASSWNAQAETISPPFGDSQSRGKPGYTLQSQTSNPMSSSAGAPSNRDGHTAIWTGSEMIVWGGSGISGVLGDGARYNPATDTWSEVSSSGAASARSHHTAIWTGSVMIIWGGGSDYPNYNTVGDGARYTPASDTWSAVSPSGAPSPRSHHTAIWTGSEMIIWGGSNSSGYLGDGARYNPASDTWTAISSSGAPSPRSYQTAIWTGSEMIIWGGGNQSGALGDGARYNPANDTWSAMSSSGAPSVRYEYSAIWTGSEIIIWGGESSLSYYNYLGDGARYNPASDTWSAISSNGVSSQRRDHTAIWTGSEMIVWGGNDGSDRLDDGARYYPATDSWTAISSKASPVAREAHTAIWTGSEMIVWGGESGWTNYLGEGARYNPVTDIWTINCYSLTVAHTGGGLDPTTSPANSNGCASGQYHAGEFIILTASPAENYYIASWVGPSYDPSPKDQYYVYMPSDPLTIVVHYLITNISDFATSSAFPNMFAVLYEYGSVPWYSSLCGSCWTPLNTAPSSKKPSQIAMVPRSDGTMRILVTVDDEGIYRTSYTGASWALYSFPRTQGYCSGNYFTNLAVSPLDPKRLFVNKYCLDSDEFMTYASYSIYTSPDSGLTWQKIRGGEYSYEYWGDIIVSPVVVNRVYTFNGASTWYQSDDSGQTWFPHNYPVDELALDAKHQDWLYGFYRSSNLDYIGERSIDGGVTWTPWSENPCEGVQQLLAHPTQSSVLFLRCETGLYRSSNGGDKWEQLSADSGQLLRTDYGKPGRLLWAKEGDMWASEDAGSTWALRGSPWNQVLPCLSGFLPLISR
jgi:N-acetylneuraminic acid mutarotase